MAADSLKEPELLGPKKIDELLHHAYYPESMTMDSIKDATVGTKWDSLPSAELADGTNHASPRAARP